MPRWEELPGVCIIVSLRHWFGCMVSEKKNAATAAAVTLADDPAEYACPAC